MAIYLFLEPHFISTASNEQAAFLLWKVMTTETSTVRCRNLCCEILVARCPWKIQTVHSLESSFLKVSYFRKSMLHQTPVSRWDQNKYELLKYWRGDREISRVQGQPHIHELGDSLVYVRSCLKLVS